MFKKIKTNEIGLMVGSNGLPSRIEKKRSHRQSYKEDVSLKSELIRFIDFLKINWKFVAAVSVVFGIYLSSYFIIRQNYEINRDEDGYYLNLPSGNRMNDVLLFIYLPLIKIEDFSTEHDGECKSC